MSLPPRNFVYPFFLELYEDAQRYTFPQSLYELKAQLGQKLAHAQTFDRGVDVALYSLNPSIVLIPWVYRVDIDICEKIGNIACFVRRIGTKIRTKNISKKLIAKEYRKLNVVK